MGISPTTCSRLWIIINNTYQLSQYQWKVHEINKMMVGTISVVVFWGGGGWFCNFCFVFSCFWPAFATHSKSSWEEINLFCAKVMGTKRSWFFLRELSYRGNAWNQGKKHHPAQLLSSMSNSKNFPTYPWNIPQASNQRFMKEFLSFGGLGIPGVCSKDMLGFS